MALSGDSVAVSKSMAINSFTGIFRNRFFYQVFVRFLYLFFHEPLIDFFAHALARVCAPLQAALRIVVGNEAALTRHVRINRKEFYFAAALRTDFHGSVHPFL